MYLPDLDGPVEHRLDMAEVPVDRAGDDFRFDKAPPDRYHSR